MNPDAVSYLLSIKYTIASLYKQKKSLSPCWLELRINFRAVRFLCKKIS